MNKQEIKLDYYPKTIIDVLIKEGKDSFIKIDDIKNSQYILKIDDKRYGPFNWDDIFNPNRILNKVEDKDFLYSNISMQDYTINFSFWDKDNNLIYSNENKISISNYYYLLNNTYKLNQILLKSDFENSKAILINFLNIFSKIVDFDFIKSLNIDFLIFKLSKNLFHLPWQVFNFFFAEKEIIPMFLTNDSIDEDFLISLKTKKLKLKELLFLKENNFEIDKKLWDRNFNKINIDNQDQFIYALQSYDFATILAHGFKKKDFSSIIIDKHFFNPFYLIEMKKAPQIIFLLSCMMNYSNSDNNLLSLFLKKGTRLIFSTPFIIPLEYIENIFANIIENNEFTIQKLLLKILKISSFSSSLIRILI